MINPDATVALGDVVTVPSTSPAAVIAFVAAACVMPTTSGTTSPENITAVLRLEPPGPIALTVTRYVPGANASKNADRSTVISPFASTAGLPRSEESIGDAVFGSAPLANTSRR